MKASIRFSMALLQEGQVEAYWWLQAKEGGVRQTTAIIFMEHTLSGLFTIGKPSMAALKLTRYLRAQLTFKCLPYFLGLPIWDGF